MRIRKILSICIVSLLFIQVCSIRPSIAAEDPVTGNIIIKKVDKTNKENPVSGAVYRLSGTSDYGTQTEKEVTTDSNGMTSFTDIEKGSYELKEISCGDDWQLDSTVYHVTIDGMGTSSIAGLTKGNGVTEEEAASAKQEKSDAESDLQNAETEIKTTEASLKTAKAEQTACSYNVLQAKNKVYTTQNIYDNAVAWESHADAQIAKGSLGFFEYLGHTEAAAVFTDPEYNDYNGYTYLGQDGDATSLKNFKKSLDFLKECNDIRVNEQQTDPLGNDALEEYTVSSYLMATSELSANAAAHKASEEGDYGHQGLAPSAEILAYDYEDPYDGWYYYEKRIFDTEGYTDENWEEIGHFLIMTEAGTTDTGFGMNTGTDVYAHVQHIGGGVGSSMTLSEYTAKFDKYYNSLINAPIYTENALNALNSAKNELKAAENNLTEKNRIVTELNQVLADAQAAKTAAENRIKTADEIIRASETWILTDAPRIHTDFEFTVMDSDQNLFLSGIQYLLSGVSDYHNTYQEYAYSGQNGQVSFLNLEPGTYQLSQITAFDGYEMMEPCRVSINETGDVRLFRGNQEVIMNADGSFRLDAKPLPETYTLSVTNTVKGSFGNKAKEFTFTATFSGDQVPDSISYTKGGDSGALLLVNGTVSFTLMHGENIVFKDLPAETGYIVEETPEMGYEVSSNNAEGVISADTTISYTNTKDGAVPTSADTNTRMMLPITFISFIVAIRIMRKIKGMA